MRGPQKNWVIPRDGPSHHLRYHLQVKTVDRCGREMLVRGVIGKRSRINKGMVLSHFISLCFGICLSMIRNRHTLWVWQRAWGRGQDRILVGSYIWRSQSRLWVSSGENELKLPWEYDLCLYTRVCVHVLVYVCVCRCVWITHFMSTPATRRENAPKYVPFSLRPVMFVSFLLCVHKDWHTWSLIPHLICTLYILIFTTGNLVSYLMYILVGKVGWCGWLAWWLTTGQHGALRISSVGNMLCECGQVSGFPHLCATGFQYLPWPPHSRPWAQTNHSIIRTRKSYSTSHI